MATATASKSQNPVGSSEWIAAEKENVQSLVDQELEEVEYPARHEMEWLNEHMAEIFRGNQLDVTEVFKTPGKMRGKTPRTVRKHQTPKSARVPLGEIFSADRTKNSPLPNTHFNQEISKLAANKDKDKDEDTDKDKTYSPLSEKQNSNPNYNADSGYHGMPDEDDEMQMIPSEQPTEPDAATQPAPETQPETQPETATQPFEESTLHAIEQAVEAPHQSPSPAAARRSITAEDSFHSAREGAPSKETTAEPMDFQYSVPSPPAQPAKQTVYPNLQSVNEQQRQTSAERTPTAAGTTTTQPDAPKSPQPLSGEQQQHDNDPDPDPDPDLDQHLDDMESPSVNSTPDRPPIRKSSLNFASLPAREPLTKRSMGGARTSHVDRGFLGRQTGGARVTQTLAAGEKNEQHPVPSDKMDIDEPPPAAAKQSAEDSQNPKLHNKSSTQLLHEKINMLGKSQPARSTKSVSATAPQVPYPELPAQRPGSSGDDGDQTVKTGREPTPQQEQLTKSSNSQPVQPQQQLQQLQQQASRQNTAEPTERPQTVSSSSPSLQKKPTGYKTLRNNGTPDRRSPASKVFKPAGVFHAKSNSTSSMLGSPRADSTQNNVAQDTSQHPESTTPVGSPSRNDGPLSASKSRLRSIMGAARGLFTTSAGASAAAKIETLSPTATRTEANSSPHQNENGKSQQNVQPESPPKQQEGRRTRGSAEREQRRKEEEELKERERRANEEREKEEQLAREREEEKQKASQPKNPPVLQKLNRGATSTIKSSPQKTQPQSKPDSNHEEDHKFAASTLPKQESRRPVKPTREVQKPKPQPVSIRVGTHSQRMAMSQHQQQQQQQQQQPSSSSAAPEPTPAKQQPSSVTKKPSTTSMHTVASSNSLKSTNSSVSSKSKAALAAERRKEQETQKKLEQRREAERKRAAQQEEEEEARRRGQAEAQHRERERSTADDPKKTAHRQAIEKRRLENAKKSEQQRTHNAAPSNSRASTMQQDRSVLGASQRSDQAPARPPSRLGGGQPPTRPNQPATSVKPPKRAGDDEGGSRAASTKPGVVQQADGKRRKTEEEEDPVQEPQTRPTMAPPIRQSNARKDTMRPQQSFAGGYATAPAQHAQHAQPGPSTLKNPAPGPRPFQPSASGQPQRSGHPLELAKYASGKIPFAEQPSSHNASQAQAQAPAPGHKAPPHQQQQQQQPQQQAPTKSSPAYPNGDAIKLPEIPTDSEESDSEAEPYNVPDWAREDNLGALLLDQDGHDGESVFGPSAPLHMEEIFRENKDRFKRFRDRTSSANWGSTGDGLTTEEVRWDLAEREKLKKNGGWTYGPS